MELTVSEESVHGWLFLRQEPHGRKALVEQKWVMLGMCPAK